MNKKSLFLLLPILLCGCFGGEGSNDTPIRSKILHLTSAGPDIKAYSSTDGTEIDGMDVATGGGYEITVNTLRLERGEGNKITSAGPEDDNILNFKATAETLTFSYKDYNGEDNPRAKYYVKAKSEMVKTTEDIGAKEPLSKYDGLITYYDVLALGGSKVRNGGLKYADFGYWGREIYKEAQTQNGIPPGTVFFEHNNLLIYDANNATGISALAANKDFRGNVIGTVSSVDGNGLHTVARLYGAAYLHVNVADAELFAEFFDITKNQGGAESVFYDFAIGNRDHTAGTGIGINDDGSFNSTDAGKLFVYEGGTENMAGAGASDMLFEGQFLGENGSNDPSEVVGDFNVTLGDQHIKTTFGAN